MDSFMIRVLIACILADTRSSNKLMRSTAAPANTTPGFVHHTKGFMLVMGPREPT